jgi:transcription elongation factor Elf1
VSEVPFVCRRCKSQAWFLFILDKANRPVLARCKACGHEELL